MQLEHIDSKADPKRGQLVALYQRMVCKVCILKAPTLWIISWLGRPRHHEKSQWLKRQGLQQWQGGILRVSLILKISQIDTTGARVEFLKSFWQVWQQFGLLELHGFSHPSKRSRPYNQTLPCIIELVCEKGDKLEATQIGILMVPGDKLSSGWGDKQEKRWKLTNCWQH